MKTILKNGMLLLMTATLLISCSNIQSQSTEDLLKAPEKRAEIMTAISDDPQMMNDMLGHMMKNDEAMQMMKGNKELMGRMAKGEQAMGMMGGDQKMMDEKMQGMMNMMKKDTAMCRSMGEMMMKDDHMRAMMADMMKEDGMGNKEMMKGKTNDHADHH